MNLSILSFPPACARPRCLVAYPPRSSVPVPGSGFFDVRVCVCEERERENEVTASTSRVDLRYWRYSVLDLVMCVMKRDVMYIREPTFTGGTGTARLRAQSGQSAAEARHPRQTRWPQSPGSGALVAAPLLLLLAGG
jgi:hypothetical protein